MKNESMSSKRTRSSSDKDEKQERQRLGTATSIDRKYGAVGDVESPEDAQLFNVVRRLDVNRSRPLQEGANSDQSSTQGKKSKIEVPDACPTVKKPKSISASFHTASGTSGPSHPSVSSMCMQWHAALGPRGTCLVGEYGSPIATAQSKSFQQNSASKLQRIAAFDLDGTLVETASGKVAYNFTDENDFRIWGATPKERQVVVQKVQKHAEKGWLIVVVTSQYGLDQKLARLKVWKKRMALISQRFGVPLFVFVSLDKDVFRKPCAGWVVYLRDLWRRGGGDGSPLDMELGHSAPDQDDESRSFFVGDAAGRDASKGKATIGRTRKADFADTDRKLAHNLHWRFFTPEEFFAEEPPQPFSFKGHRPSTPPTKLDQAETKSESATGGSKALQSLRKRLLAYDNPQTLLVLIGPQASGKSYFATSLTGSSNSNWVRVNRDTLKSVDRCLSVAKKALSEGKSVVVDNTNPSIDARRAFIDLVAQTGKVNDVRLVALHFDFPLHVVQHNDLYRSKWWYRNPQKDIENSTASASTFKKEKGAPTVTFLLHNLPKPIPPVAFRTFYKNLQPPEMADSKANDSITQGSTGEGWDEVIRITNFEFDSLDEHEIRAWRKWFA